MKLLSRKISPPLLPMTLQRKVGLLAFNGGVLCNCLAIKVGDGGILVGAVYC
jgi:hypothetical protein